MDAHGLGIDRRLQRVGRIRQCRQCERGTFGRERSGRGKSAQRETQRKRPRRASQRGGQTIVESHLEFHGGDILRMCGGISGRSFARASWPARKRVRIMLLRMMPPGHRPCGRCRIVQQACVQACAQRRFIQVDADAMRSASARWPLDALDLLDPCRRIAPQTSGRCSVCRRRMLTLASRTGAAADDLRVRRCRDPVTGRQ
jgi:hypothetical protein